MLKRHTPLPHLQDTYTPATPSADGHGDVFGASGALKRMRGGGGWEGGGGWQRDGRVDRAHTQYAEHVGDRVGWTRGRAGGGWREGGGCREEGAREGIAGRVVREFHRGWPVGGRQGECWPRESRPDGSLEQRDCGRASDRDWDRRRDSRMLDHLDGGRDRARDRDRDGYSVRDSDRARHGHRERGREMAWERDRERDRERERRRT